MIKYINLVKTFPVTKNSAYSKWLSYRDVNFMMETKYTMNALMIMQSMPD